MLDVEVGLAGGGDEAYRIVRAKGRKTDAAAAAADLDAVLFIERSETPDARALYA